MDGICSADFVERVRINQSKLSCEMKSQYDFIICGSGSAGSVVARRLAENPEVSVLLIEAGGDDNVPSVNEPGQWFRNLGSERDWNFSAEPNPHLNGRVLPMNMGKVLGGGSSINLMAWMRGHRDDWDFFASEAADPAWSYESILGIYRRIEDWHGAPDPDRRGVGGPIFVQPAPDPHPIGVEPRSCEERETDLQRRSIAGNTSAAVIDRCRASAGRARTSGTRGRRGVASYIQHYIQHCPERWS